MSPLGLIAGEGVFPLLVARGARASRSPKWCAARWPTARGRNSPQSATASAGSVSRASGNGSDFCAKPDAAEAIMVGRVKKTRMYGSSRRILGIFPTCGRFGSTSRRSGTIGGRTPCSSASRTSLRKRGSHSSTQRATRPSSSRRPEILRAVFQPMHNCRTSNSAGNCAKPSAGSTSASRSL